MNEQWKWIISMLAVPIGLLLIVLGSQWEYTTTGSIHFHASFFEGEEALFILAVLKLLLTVISVYTFILIYKKFTEKEDDNSSTTEPVQSILSQNHPALGKDQNIAKRTQSNVCTQSNKTNIKKKLFNIFLLGWNILWLGFLMYKIMLDEAFIGIIVFIWPFLLIAYLIPYIIAIIHGTDT